MAGIFSRRIQFLKLFDFMLFFSVAALVTIGILFIYSAGFNSDGINVSGEYIKQIIWAFIGLFMMFFVMLIDYRGLEKHAGKLFIALIVVLVITRLFGKKINGARSWLSIGPLGIQPSEFCKILY
ncbi:FtsW/RodA/SpoVE family cell cycle protein, partial [Treponema saccharophilum]